MTIEKLSASKVLISLCTEDMENFSLSISEMGLYNERSRKILMRLLELARKETGLGFSSKSVLMEALPVKSGCLLLITFADKNKKKTYKVKDVKGNSVYVFDNAEQLLSAAERLYYSYAENCENSLWLFTDKYYLIFSSPMLRKNLRKVLETFACCLHLKPVDISRIKEGGKKLSEGNALSLIGRKMCIKSTAE